MRPLEAAVPVIVVPGDSDPPLATPDPTVPNVTCSSLSSCFLCLRNDHCGWCAGEHLCIPGDVWGPTTSLECASKWSYTVGQCYITQSTMILGTLATLSILLLAMTGCMLFTFYRLKRQRLMAREYVRLFSEYSEQHQRRSSLARYPTAQGGSLYATTFARGADGGDPGYESSTDHPHHYPVFYTPHGAPAVPPVTPPSSRHPHRGLGLVRAPLVGGLGGRESLDGAPTVHAWYGSFGDDCDDDSEPADLFARRADSGLFAHRVLADPNLADVAPAASAAAMDAALSSPPPGDASGALQRTRDELRSQFKRRDPSVER